MRTLFLDCGMGAAGDMLSAALLELFEQPDAVLNHLNAIGISKVKYIPEESVKCGICGTHMKVLVDGVEEGADTHTHEHHEHTHAHGEQHHEHEHTHTHEHHHEHHDQGETHHHVHHHTSMEDIRGIVSGLHLPEKVKEDVLAVYTLIAQAESEAHGKDISEIHFHEVGMLDAIADVTAVCFMLNELKPDKIIASPVCVGSGFVHCAHGTVPVPAPATAILLSGVPTYAGDIESELCTPTGAALLKYFADEFQTQPLMRTEKIGYGMGKKDFAKVNCVRAILGEMENQSEQMLLLSCNIDDMTGEEIGALFDRLYSSGAREVFTTPIGMKKSRPGILLTVIGTSDDRDKLIHALFKHTTTLGIREEKIDRYILNREIKEVNTPYGTVRKKISDGYGVHREKWEYEDVCRLAKEQDVSYAEMVIRLSHC